MSYRGGRGGFRGGRGRGGGGGGFENRRGGGGGGGFGGSRFVSYGSSSGYERKSNFKGDGERFGRGGGSSRNDDYRRYREDDYRGFKRRLSPDNIPRKRMRGDFYEGDSPRRSYGQSDYSRRGSFRDLRNRMEGDDYTERERFGGRGRGGRGRVHLSRSGRGLFTTRSGFISKRRLLAGEGYKKRGGGFSSKQLDLRRLKMSKIKRRRTSDDGSDDKLDSDYDDDYKDGDLDDDDEDEMNQEEIEEGEVEDEGVEEEEEEEMEEVEEIELSEEEDEEDQETKEDAEGNEKDDTDGKDGKAVSEGDASEAGDKVKAETDQEGDAKSKTTDKKKKIVKKVVKKVVKVVKKTKPGDAKKEEAKDKNGEELPSLKSFVQSSFKLNCPLCSFSSIHFKTYGDHLKSSKHQTAFKEALSKARQKLTLMRTKQREIQRGLDEKSKDLRLKTFFCHICRLNYKTLKSEHLLSSSHLKIKQMVLPYCKVCRVKFKNTFMYEHHCCSFYHLKRKARIERLKTAPPKDDDLGEDELDPSNFMVLDAVGSGEEDVGPSDDETVDVRTKKKSSTDIGTEHCKLVEIYHCELCGVYLTNPGKQSEVLNVHCRTRHHLRLHVKHKEEQAKAAKLECSVDDTSQMDDNHQGDISDDEAGKEYEDKLADEQEEMEREDDEREDDEREDDEREEDEREDDEREDDEREDDEREDDKRDEEAREHEEAHEDEMGDNGDGEEGEEGDDETKGEDGKVWDRAEQSLTDVEGSDCALETEEHAADDKALSDDEREDEPPKPVRTTTRRAAATKKKASNSR